MKIAIIGANAPDSMERHFADAFQFADYEAKIFDIYDKNLPPPYCSIKG